MSKSNAGRPTVMTDETIRILEEAFLCGATDKEACCEANIAPSSLYLYCENNPEFSERKEVLKNKPTIKAKKIINKALDEEDLATAHRVIDRKEGSKVRQEITGAGGGAVKVEWEILPVTPINQANEKDA